MAQGIGWRRGLAAGLMLLGGLATPLDLLAPDDPMAALEALYARAGVPELARTLKAQPSTAHLWEESRWRAATRRTHRKREILRTLVLAAGAVILAVGILRRRRWAAALLGAGLFLWTGLYALDLAEGRRFLGHLPVGFAWGQGLNLLFILGLGLWLRRDDRQAPAWVVPSGHGLRS